MSNLNLFSFSLKSLPLVLPVYVLEKSLSLSFLWASFRYWNAATLIHRSFLSLNSNLSCCCHRCSNALTIFSGPPLDLFLEIHVVLMLGNPELDAALQVWAHQGGTEWQNHLLWLAGHRFCTKLRTKTTQFCKLFKQTNNKKKTTKKKPQQNKKPQPTKTSNCIPNPPKVAVLLTFQHSCLFRMCPGRCDVQRPFQGVWTVPECNFNFSCQEKSCGLAQVCPVEVSMPFGIWQL